MPKYDSIDDEVLPARRERTPEVTRVLISGRIPKELRDRVRVSMAQRDVTLQEALTEGLTLWLDRAAS